TKDECRPRSSVEVMTLEIIEKTHKILLEDHRLKLTTISEIVKISKEHVGKIVHVILGMQKCYEGRKDSYSSYSTIKQ
ncbi:hypothetical protein CEXT_349061, partial [Caerostris extrusa]